MRGLQHNVIEIKDTQNEEIDRILVFLKPGNHSVELAGTRQQAEDILRKVRVHRRMPSLKVNHHIVTAVVVAGMVVLALILALL